MSKSLKTIIGTLLIKGDGKAIVSIALDSTPESDPSAIETAAVDELEEYFIAKRKVFTFPYVFSGSTFTRPVYEELLKVPYGRVVSYQELASRVGDGKKCRAVGNAIHKNPLPILIPCHRVIKKDGSLGGFGMGVEIKRLLLQHERINSL